MRLRVPFILAFIFAIATLDAQTQFTLRIQWEIEGPAAQAGQTRPPFDVTTAQSYIYKVYVVGAATGNTLTGVTCTTTTDQFIKTCAAALPEALDQPGVSIDMTATVDGIETIHSTAAVIPPKIIPPTPPTNPRIIRVQAPAIGGSTAKPTTPTK